MYEYFTVFKKLGKNIIEESICSNIEHLGKKRDIFNSEKTVMTQNGLC